MKKSRSKMKSYAKSKFANYKKDSMCKSCKVSKSKCGCK